MARHFATQIGAIRANRYARINSQKKKTEFAVKLSEFSSPKQYSRNSIRPFPRIPNPISGRGGTVGRKEQLILHRKQKTNRISTSIRKKNMRGSVRKINKKKNPVLGTPPAWHRGLPGPSGPEPQKSPKRVLKGVLGPPATGSPRVPKECAPESGGSPKTQLRTLLDSFRTPALFGDSGAPRPEAPGHPFRLFWGSGPEELGREPSVPGRGVPNPCFHNVRAIRSNGPSNLRFAGLSAPKQDSPRRGFSSGNLK